MLFAYFHVLDNSHIPRYLNILMSNGIKSFDEALRVILAEFSPFLEEGKNLLIEEFGKDYGTYFAILELMASGKTSRPEIESILGRSVGGYLERLEGTYDLIRRIIPFGEKPASRLAKFTGLPTVMVNGTRPARLASYLKSSFFYLLDYEQVRSELLSKFRLF